MPTTTTKKQAPRRRGPLPRQAPPERRASLGSRRTLLVAAGVVALAAAAIAVSLIGASGGEEERAPAPVASGGYLAGVPQDGAFLGSPDAPFVLVEYADVQCPYCAEYALDVLPGIVDRYVRTGRVRLEFRGLAFLGPDSEEALRVTLAAGEQDRLWHVLDGLYARQGAENSDWVTPELIRTVGAGVPELDVARMLAGAAGVDAAIAKASEQSKADGIRGTPSFLIAPRGGGGTPQRLEPRALTLEAFVEMIDAAIAG